MKMTISFLLTFYTCILSITHSARILGVFPVAGSSHIIYDKAVLRSLAKAKHDIIVMTSLPKEYSEENFTSVIDISEGFSMYSNRGNVEQLSRLSTSDFLEIGNKIEILFCKNVLHSNVIQEALKSREKLFDVIFVQAFYQFRCYFHIAEKLNIPIIGVASRNFVSIDWEMSNPRHPLLVPGDYMKTINHHNFFGRLWNTLEYCKFTYYFYTTNKNVQNRFYQENVNFTSYEKCMKIKLSLIFVNSHFSYFSRPINPNTIEIGGITMKVADELLQKEIQTFLDGAKNGAILLSFGSVIRSAKIPKYKIQALKQAFAEIPQRVIWKYEEELDGLSDNIMLLKWLPQQAILAHQNTRAFITHCGQGAIQESIYHGVPFVSCPLFADQYSNANIIENLGIAVHLDYQTITKNNVLKALNEVINNTKYFEKMQKQSKIFKDQPMTPQELVVYWTEYVIRHNGALHLTSPATELNWFQYLLLDVISFLILAIFVMLYIIYFIGKLFYTFISLKL